MDQIRHVDAPMENHSDNIILLRSIVNQSATMTNNTKEEMPTYDRAIHDMKSGANLYRVC